MSLVEAEKAAAMAAAEAGEVEVTLTAERTCHWAERDHELRAGAVDLEE